MKKHMVVALVMTVLIVVPASAAAETVLISKPIPTGQGGFSCTCINISKSSMPSFYISIYPSFGLSGSAFGTISPGQVIEYILDRGAGVAAYCMALRGDSVSVSSKKLACTMSALDANENPTVTVPVDIKYKR